MKKNLLTIALVAGALLPVSAQWYQIGGTVKVKPGALKYVSGPQSITGGKESNEGKVKVDGKFSVADGANIEFRNEFNSPTQYGQLIIKAGPEASEGKVVGEYMTPGNANFYKAPIAIPYVEVTADQIADAAKITNKAWQNHPGDGKYSANRWKNPVNVWDNTHYALRDMKSGDEVKNDSEYFKPTNYYTVNNKLQSLGYRQTDYTGRPANMSHSVVLTPFKVDGRTNYKRNMYGEMLGTYLYDPFATSPMPTGWNKKGSGPTNKPAGYGDNYYYLGNPFTSNIDLTSILSNSHIKGVVQFTNIQFSENDGSNAVRQMPLKATYNGGVWSGDKSVLRVRPYHTFGVKTDGTLVTLALDDNVKTFEDKTPKKDSTPEGPAAPSYNARTIRSNNGLKQVQVKLKSSDNVELARTYVVASESFKAAAKMGNQAYVSEMTDDMNGIYTLEENEDGSYISEGKLYINGINDKDYVGKPVYVAHQVANPGKFILSFDLSEGVNGGNKFYFEDKEAGTIKEITPKFTYTFNATESSKDRFAIYWNNTPKTLSVEDNAVVSQETVVYKDNSSFKVRFAKDIKGADVYVYNVLGQLVHSKQGVNTSADYVLPLDNSSSAYVVKIVGDNGKVTTKKIVK